jgi:hypothetical protein
VLRLTLCDHLHRIVRPVVERELFAGQASQDVLCQAVLGHQIEPDIAASATEGQWRLKRGDARSVVDACPNRQQRGTTARERILSVAQCLQPPDRL